MPADHYSIRRSSTAGEHMDVPGVSTMFRRATGRPRLSIGAGFTLVAVMLGLAAEPTTLANAQAAAGNTLTVILAPFANNDKEHRGGGELAKWAEDAVAVELANSGR